MSENPSNNQPAAAAPKAAAGVDVITVRCPHCSARLAVRNRPGIESRTITCLACGERSPFGKFIRINAASVKPQQQGEHTQYKTDTPPAAETAQQPLLIGVLKLGEQESFRLKPGKNIVGRQAAGSSATIQLPTGESKRMSREHLVVEVKRVAGKGFVHYASLYKEKVNATLISGARLEYGDAIVLQPGDTIQLPDVTLRFELVSGEETDI